MPEEKLFAHPKRIVKRFYNPPGLLFRQAFSAFYLAYVSGWRRLPFWLLRLNKTLPVAAGAVGMGCIGYPNHPVWEITTACNLRCRHCHASGGRRSPDELTTSEGKCLLLELAGIDAFRMIVFTGGEPLVRPDIFELAEYASRLGLVPVIATNATLIDRQVARDLRRAGVACLAISLDAADPVLHNFIRNREDAFALAVRGIEACRAAGMALQINITAMADNREQIPAVYQLADRYRAEVVLTYQLVPVGRGAEIGERELNRQANRTLMETIARHQRRAYPVIEPVAGPQYWPYLVEKKGNGLARKLAPLAFKGCVAGTGLCYIKPDGDVWACPFLPVKAGNVREQPMAAIWKDAPLFRELREREKTLKGQCGSCSYNRICGGCRGRAYAHSGDYLAEDPSCFLRKY